MKKLVLVLLLLIVGIVPVGAQDAEPIPYTLKQVSIEDYLAALPAILNADAVYASRCILHDGTEIFDASAAQITLWQVSDGQIMPTVDAILCG